MEQVMYVQFARGGGTTQQSLQEGVIPAEVCIKQV